eukprot:100847-Alexandrium_andersonii.AAC.1
MHMSLPLDSPSPPSHPDNASAVLGCSDLLDHAVEALDHDRMPVLPASPDVRTEELLRTENRLRTHVDAEHTQGGVSRSVT